MAVVKELHVNGAARPVEAVAAYVAMARLTAVRALAAGVLTADRAEALLDVLGSGSSR